MEKQAAAGVEALIDVPIETSRMLIGCKCLTTCTLKRT